MGARKRTHGDLCTARNDVARLVNDAKDDWQRDRSAPGGLSQVTVELLSERLADALADVTPLRNEIARIDEAASDAIAGAFSSDQITRLRAAALDAGVDGAGVLKGLEAIKSAKPEALAGAMLEFLEAAVDFYGSRVPVMTVQGIAPAVVVAEAPVRAKKSRLGSTTMSLFLGAEDGSGGDTVKVTDPLPSGLGPVRTDREAA